MGVRIKKGDLVIVIRGKNKGKTGKVLKVLPKEERVVVEKVNMIKKHTRPSQANPQGGIVDKEGSLPVSAVMPVDPRSGRKGTRVGYQTLTDGKKVRVARRSGETIA